MYLEGGAINNVTIYNYHCPRTSGVHISLPIVWKLIP